ncbi:MAG: hypothetical protein QF441_11270 [Bacteriovoracaceae bacterium]|jgi:hypothetical protein|nr:hypothetical protein [Bacteriovoracaceae bacterium]
MTDKERMKLSLLVIFLFFSFNSFSECECIAISDNRELLRQQAQTASECKNILIADYLKMFESNKICQNKEKEYSYKWSCHSAPAIKNFQDQKVTCEDLKKEIENFSAVERTLGVIMAVDELHEQINVLAGSKSAYDSPCQRQNENNILSEFIEEDSVVSLEIKLQDQNSLEEALKKLMPETGKIPGDVLDQIEHGSFSFSLLNDNNWLDYENGGSGDDIGKTHGLKFTFVKAIDGIGYNLRIEYQSELNTNFLDPINKNFWLDNDGNYHVDQYFIEENIFKFLLEKEKSGDAFYWNFGGGVQQLNKEDGEGTLGILSALGSQARFHEQMVRLKPGSARLYNNLGQLGSQQGVFLEAGVGKRSSLYQDQKNRVYVENYVEARYSPEVTGASYLGTEAGVYYARALTQNSAVRLGLGYQGSAYEDGSSQKGRFILVEIGGKSYKVSFRYEQTYESADYLNALPEDFADKLGQKSVSTSTGTLDRDKYKALDEGIWRLQITKNF